jgi:manganese efflux pump family protein
MHHFLTSEIKLALFVLSLGIDTFTVAVGLGISGIGRKNRLRVGVSFALFEGLMPLIGFLLGHAVSNLFGNIASVLGILILFGIGVWMIKEAFSREDKKLKIDTRKGLVFTSLSVSMDELAVGFSMGTLGLPIILTVILIALQAFVLTVIGTTFGNRIGEVLAERAEFVAGFVLCTLAILLLLGNILHINL